MNHVYAFTVVILPILSTLSGEVLLVEPAFVMSTRVRGIVANCASCFMWTDTPFPCKNCCAVRKARNYLAHLAEILVLMGRHF